VRQTLEARIQRRKFDAFASKPADDGVSGVIEEPSPRLLLDGCWRRRQSLHAFETSGLWGKKILEPDFRGSQSILVWQAR
jgi:hypothetical protein